MAPTRRPPRPPTMVAAQIAPDDDNRELRKQAVLAAMEREKALRARMTMFPVDEMDPPAMLRVYVPDHTVTASVLVFAKMTIDALLDDIIHELIDELGVDLQGAREGITKELYGLYAMATQTWCRLQYASAHYGIYNPEEAQLVELRLKSKYKDEDITDAYEMKSAPTTSKGHLAHSNVSRDIHNRKTFRILLAECALTLQAECDPATTVAAVIAFCCESRDTWQGQEDSFEILAHLQPPNSDQPPSTVILRPPKTLSSNCDYFHITRLEVRRASLRLNVRLPSGSTMEQVLHPDRTVDEILLKVTVAAEAAEGLPDGNWELYLLPAKGAQMMLDKTRTLRSYRITGNDMLMLSDKNAHKGSKLKQAQMLFLKISCPQFKCDRTMKFSDKATVAEVIYSFAKKTKDIQDIAKYGLFPASSLGRQLDVTRSLRDSRIPNMAQMTLKLHGGPPNEIYKVKEIFGVEPQTMTLVQADSERRMMVPDVLEELKRALLDSNGLDAEDIFRKKGNKLKEKVIVEELQAGTFFEDGPSLYDPHDIANVILEFYSRLPTPVLSVADDDDLAMCAVDEEECHSLPNQLREPYRSLFYWLLELLFEVDKNNKVNNMDIKALADCWAPHMLPRPNDFMRRALQDQSTSSIISTILEGMGSDWGSQVHGGTMRYGSASSSFGTMEENKFLRHHLL